MKSLLAKCLLVATVCGGPSSITHADKKENEYDDLVVAELSATETARLAELDGKWKRPLYSKPDPKYAAAWADITSYEIPEWLIDATSQPHRKANFRIVATFHHARTWNYAYKDFDPNFYTAEQKKMLDLFDPEKADFFFGMPGGKVTIEDFAKQWRAKILEVVDKYSPDLIWFDGVNRTLPNSPENYVVEVLKHYLETATANGQEPVLCNKLPGGDKQNFCRFNFPEDTGIRCYEGGRNMPPDAGGYWLTDRAISYPWSYTHDKSYNLGPDVHVRALADQTARGGIYLLSLTPMASGEIHPKEKAICYGIGDWLKVNGAAIYNTRRWKIPAEGPITSWKLVEGREGIMWDYKKPNQEGEFRFTQSKDGNTVYAIMMTWPNGGKALIKSFQIGSKYHPEDVTSVKLIGSDEALAWKRTDVGLEITLPKNKPCDYAYAFKIE